MIGLVGIGMAAPANASPKTAVAQARLEKKRSAGAGGDDINLADYAPAAAALVTVGCIPGLYGLSGNYVKRESPIEAYMVGIDADAAEGNKGKAKGKAKSKPEEGAKKGKKVNLETAPS